MKKKGQSRAESCSGTIVRPFQNQNQKQKGFYSRVRKSLISKGFLKEFVLAVAANKQHWKHKQNKQNNNTMQTMNEVWVYSKWRKIPATHDTEWILYSGEITVKHDARDEI